MLNFDVLRFDFGMGRPAADMVKVTPETDYSEAAGFGFLPGSVVYARSRPGEESPAGDFCIPLRAVFRMDVPDGVYRITLLSGDPLAETRTTVRGPGARSLLDPLAGAAGCPAVESFSIRVDGGSLLLSFTGAAPRINMLEIRPDPEARVLYLAGDSTVTDQGEAGFPYAGWGQYLPERFKAGIAVENRALSGRSSKSFMDEGHWERILATLRVGDYVMAQFGHNDAKPDPARRTEPFTTYKDRLKVYIEGTRRAEAQPVLVTPVHRRAFDGQGRILNTHGGYIEAMRELAASEQVPLIDLADKSRELFERYGPEGTKDLFMWSYPGEFLAHPAGVSDNTHFQVLGARLLAGLVADAMDEAGLHGLAIYQRRN